jgi:hypothetical protein
MSSQSRERHTGDSRGGKEYLGNVLDDSVERESNMGRTSLSIPLLTLQKVTGIFKKELLYSFV